MKEISFGSFSLGNNLPLAIIAGPCQLESRDHAFEMIGALKEITSELDIPFIYKTSFDKANRTSAQGARGIGLEKALAIFEDLRKIAPLLTDVHEAGQCQEVASVVDVLQIPAFLCRQTDLLKAAAETGKIINIKKGQFLAPWDAENITKKMSSFGNEKVMLTERGVSFGYNTLVNDMRALPIMAKTGYPIVFDATHSVQQPGGQGDRSGGDRRMVPPLARAATAVGISAVFLETHQDPDQAPSDGPNMVPLNEMKKLLQELKQIDALVKSFGYP